MPKEFAEFGGGDVFSLSGSIALSFIHPIAIILTLSLPWVSRRPPSPANARGHARSGPRPADLAANVLPDASPGVVRLRRHDDRGAPCRRRERGSVRRRQRRARLREAPALWLNLCSVRRVRGDQPGRVGVLDRFHGPRLASRHRDHDVRDGGAGLALARGGKAAAVFAFLTSSRSLS